MYIPPHLRNNEKTFQINDLCNEFIHIDDTPEANIENVCCSCNCHRKSVTAVAVVRNKGEIIYSKVYRNFRKFNETVHAESFIVFDPRLRSKLLHATKLDIYITFQPCHYSGGHEYVQNISCTELLLNFQEKCLAKNGILMEIHIGYIYRAHWQIDCVAMMKYTTMVRNAITGFKLLLENNIKISVINENDINNVLIQHCDTNIVKKWFTGFYSFHMEKRKELEKFMNDYIEQIKETLDKKYDEIDDMFCLLCE